MGCLVKDSMTFMLLFTKPKVGMGLLEGVNVRVTLAGCRGGQEHMGVVVLTLSIVVVECRSYKS